MDKDDETKAWRLAYKEFCQEHIPEGTTNLQNIFTPYDLCYDMIRKLETYSGGFKDKTFCVFNLEFAEVLCYILGIDRDKVWFVTDCEYKKRFAEAERYKGINVKFVEFGAFLKENWNMKFDCVIGNPPYQAPSKNNNKGAGNTLWGNFVEKSFEIVKSNGFVALIHPSGWRNVGGRFSKTGDLLRSKQIKYLETHNADDGLKTFGAGTRYDWYIATNTYPKEHTMIVGEDGSSCKINLANGNFIPNGRVREITRLFAENVEDRIDFLYNCNYHSVTGPVSKIKNNEFTHPCIQHVSSKDNIPSCIYYSSTKNKGHFGIPKIIFGRQVSGILIDKNGKYGMSDCCAAIIDKPDNLEKIQQAMVSEKFIELMKMCDVGGNRDRYNRKVIALFRKDFWKEFI